MATNVTKSAHDSQFPGKASQPIYLDYAATTPVDPRVASKMMQCLTQDGVFANPASSSHRLGLAARDLVEQARAQVAGLIGAKATDIVWTSGATESDNLAIKGTAYAGARDNRRHIITSKVEHKAVLDSCKRLQVEGFDVTYLVPDAFGLVSPSQVEQAMRDDTVLVSIMQVNNETGAVNDIAGIGALCRERGITFHVDAAQSAGKLPINVQAMPVDLMSFAAHKVYGPKGVGALYVCSNPRVRIEPLIHGGGHEKGLRAGTLATHQIVGMGEAFELARVELAAESARLEALRERFLDGVMTLEGVHLNGSSQHRVPGIVNLSFAAAEGESLLFALRELAVSSGSACNSATNEASYVLRALGRSDQLAQSSIRFSFGRFSTEQEVDRAIELVVQEVPRLRAMGQGLS